MVRYLGFLIVLYRSFALYLEVKKERMARDIKRGGQAGYISLLEYRRERWFAGREVFHVLSSAALRTVLTIPHSPPSN